MKITVVGTGYVGLVTGACFAEVGIDVTCVDIDQNKIDNLNKGILPIWEPGLEEVVERNVAKEVGAHMKDYLLMVTNSTVPVGTAELVRKAMKEALDSRGANIPS